MADKKTAYVGMALSGAPDEFKIVFRRELQDAFSEFSDVEILDFIGLEKGDDTEVYIHDKRCAETADLCIFICDHPSTGMGMEIGFRLKSGKPMICFGHVGNNITRMVTGMCKVENILFHHYDHVCNIAHAARAHFGLS